MANKANISAVPVERYVISATDVANYLQTQVLGFNIGTGYRVFFGIDRMPHYIEMVISIAEKDIVMDNPNPDYVDRALMKNGASVPLKDNVLTALKQFMYPSNMDMIRNIPEARNRMQYLGVFGEALDKLINESKLTCAIDKTTGKRIFAVALDASKIIADMLADPTTDEPAGKVVTLGVAGKMDNNGNADASTIKWDVALVKTTNSSPVSGVAIDAIFANPVFKK